MECIVRRQFCVVTVCSRVCKVRSAHNTCVSIVSPTDRQFDRTNNSSTPMATELALRPRQVDFNQLWTLLAPTIDGLLNGAHVNKLHYYNSFEWVPPTHPHVPMFQLHLPTVCRCADAVCRSTVSTDLWTSPSTHRSRVSCKWCVA
jgi:hypothetical protein